MQIVAIGGGGFTHDCDPQLDAYVLAQCSAERPRVGFLATASGDEQCKIERFYSRLQDLNIACQLSHLALFRRPQDVSKWALNQDLIYVGGGNTKSMIAVWNAWGLPSALRTAADNGTVLAGVSAGAVCWFEFALTDNGYGAFEPLPGLDFVGGSCCPHYSSEPQRQPAFQHHIGAGMLPDGIAIDDGVAVHFCHSEVARVVTARAGANAYSVRRLRSGVESRALNASVL